MTFKYTLGADPEMLVRDKLTKLIVPVCGKIGGTKDKPVTFIKTDGQPLQGYMYQEDNVSFEVNIPPAQSASTFIRSIEKVLHYSEKKLVEAGLYADTRNAAHRFAADQLLSDQAKTIGCDPDMCAYGGADDAPMAREPFDIKDLGTWRYAGGHVHFGYDPDLGVPHHVIVRLIDACVYLPILHKDKQKARRPKYGLAGLYRPKPYGVEYRSMSNFWLSDPAVVAGRCFQLMYDLHNNLELIHAFYQALPIEKIKECIDSGGTDQQAVVSEVTRCANWAKLNISANFQDSKSTIRSMRTWGYGSNPGDYMIMDDFGGTDQ